MIPAEIIEKKRDGKHLNSNEIKWFIDNIVKNTDPASVKAIPEITQVNGKEKHTTIGIKKFIRFCKNLFLLEP